VRACWIESTSSPSHRRRWNTEQANTHVDWRTHAHPSRTGAGLMAGNGAAARRECYGKPSSAPEHATPHGRRRGARAPVRVLMGGQP